MDAFMDMLWDHIMAMIQHGAGLLDRVLMPLHPLGPVFILTVLALLTVLTTKLLGRFLVTRRYMELEKEFNHWFKVREEALRADDNPEKARRLARNIDQGKLNQLYWDYFLEGLLLGLVRNVLPIFIMVAYVNEAFRAEELQRLFGRSYLFALSTSSGKQLLVGSIFYYVVILIILYVSWAFLARLITGRGKVAPRHVDSISPDTV